MAVASPRWLPRVGLVVGWALFVANTLALLIIAVRGDLQSASSGLIDDSYYYLEIGQRLADGQGATFDGVHQTNGFHPLWQGIVAVVAFLAADDGVYVRSVLVVGVACFVGALLLLVDVARRLVGIGPALFGALVAFHGVDRNVNGMESALVSLLAAGLVWTLAWWDRGRSTGRLVAVSAVCVALVLARLDYGLVIWLVPAAMVWRTRNWRTGATLAGLVVLPLAAFGMWWWVAFGNPIPVSAIAKRAWVDDFYRSKKVYERPSWSMIPVAISEFWTYLERLWKATVTSGLPPKTRPRAWIVALFAVGGAVVAGSGALARRRAARSAAADADGSGREDRPGPPGVGWVLVVGALVMWGKVAIDIVVSPNWALTWYSAAPRIAVPMTIGVLVFIGVAWLFDRAWVLGLVALVLCGALVIAPRTTELWGDDLVEADPLRWVTPLDDAGVWIRDHGPAGRYAALDAGIIGFDLHDSPDKELVNIDGLVNNHRMAEMVANRSTIGERLAAVDADFLVNRADARLKGTDMTCATVLWESADIGGYPITVFDIRGCDFR